MKEQLWLGLTLYWLAFWLVFLSQRAMCGRAEQPLTLLDDLRSHRAP
jgi:hypothetical protein